MDIGFPASLLVQWLSHSSTASSILGSSPQFILVDLGLTIRELFLEYGDEVMVVSLLLFDEVAAAVINPIRIAAFYLGRGKFSVGPSTAAEDTLLVFVFRFLACRPRAFLLQTENKSAKPGCTIFFPSPLSPLPVTSHVDCCCSMLDCIE